MNAEDISLDEQVVNDAQVVLAHHAKSFRLASLFLPADRANDAAVVYQFCRLVDDAVDEAASKHEARQNIDAIAKELRGEAPPRIEVASYLAVCHRLSIPMEAATALMEGVYSDLGTVRLQTDADLARYSYQVAGVVGRMMCGVLGVTSDKAIPHAIDLGIAMQITNICRDVLEDAQRDRIYLPNDRLKQHGIKENDLVQNTVPGKQLIPVVLQLLSLAEVCYQRGRAGMHYIPFRTRVAILIASRVYRAIGIKLQRKHNGNPLHGRTIVSKMGKFWQVFRGILDAFHPVTLGWMSVKIPPSPFYDDWRELTEEPIGNDVQHNSQ